MTISYNGSKYVEPTCPDSLKSDESASVPMTITTEAGDFSSDVIVEFSYGELRSIGTHSGVQHFRKCFYSGGELHSVAGEPSAIWISGSRSTRQWHSHGAKVRHVIVSNPGGDELVIADRRYDADGRLDRDGAPASMTTLPNGTIVETYYRHGVKHRDDGPAVTRIFPDAPDSAEIGSGKNFEFWIDGSPVKGIPLSMLLRSLPDWEHRADEFASSAYLRRKSRDSDRTDGAPVDRGKPRGLKRRGQDGREPAWHGAGMFVPARALSQLDPDTLRKVVDAIADVSTQGGTPA